MAVALLTADELESLIQRAVLRALQLHTTAETLTTQQAARLTNRSEKTVRRWVASRHLPAVRRGRSLVIRRSDLDAYLGGREEEGASARKILSTLKK